MTRALPRLAACALMGVLVLASQPVAAHSVVTVLDNETHLLHDAADDSYAVIDGYDVVDLYAREVWFSALGEGVVFRISVYGGFNALLPQAQQLSLELNLTSGGMSRAFALNTTDGRNWTGNMTLLDTMLAPGLLGDTLVLQTFVSLADLGATRGDILTGFRLESRVDGALLDVAPGGRYLAGAEVPEESEAPNPTLALRGPFGYTSTEASLSGPRVALAVTNLITVQEQHIFLDVPSVPGWTVQPPAEAGYAVQANQSVTFELVAQVTPGAADLVMYVLSDLGGRERVSLSAPPPPPVPVQEPPPEDPVDVVVERPTQPPPSPEDEPPMPSPEPETEPDVEPETEAPPADGQDTPSVGALSVVLMLAFAVAVRRR